MTDTPTPTTRLVKTYLLELGVFDDFDVQPTLITGFLIPNPDVTPEQLLHAFVEYADEIRDVAVQQYGRKFPHSAEFWFCSVQEQEVPE